MNEDLEVFFEGASGTGSYLESLAKTRTYLTGAMLEKLDKVIDLELDLALMGAEKAKSEVLKLSTDNVKPIK